MGRYSNPDLAHLDQLWGTNQGTVAMSVSLRFSWPTRKRQAAGHTPALPWMTISKIMGCNLR